jgi:RHS repeat-associated protein
VPGYVDILGVAFSTNLVYVNSQIANRKGEYFWKELSMNNTTGSVWQPVTVTATGLTAVIGNVFVAKTPEVFSYDLDGNMTSDGRWNYTWDAENRLIKVESHPDTPSSSWRRIEWTYDAFGRRIQQVKSIWTNNAWFVVENLKFVSDPMLFGRHIVELNATNNTLVRSYAWSLDLSGTKDGAGGVGGLAWVTLHTASGSASGTHFVCYDGNGNIVALVSATTGDVTARYEYGPFGEPIRISGPAATLNPFRFSTMRGDDVMDLLFYARRAYTAAQGRFLSRDPIAEEWGANLYAFCGNDPVESVEILGLWGADVHKARTVMWAGDLQPPYPRNAAEAIGNANAAVDGFLSPYSWWPFGDQSYHFNRNLGGGTDSRMEHQYAHEHQAASACNIAEGRDNPEEAAAHLGVALHAAQDWVAHGDFFARWEGPIIAAHNAYSLQRDIPPGVGKVGVVDNLDYDAVMADGSIAPDGRPAGAAMRYYTTPAGPVPKRGDPPRVGMLVDWAEFKYVGEANGLRAKKTKEVTTSILRRFQDHVRKSGGCRCKRYFGVQ